MSTPISTLDKLKCAQRELALRRSVYQKRVTGGLMTQAKVDHEIAAMAAIVEDYTRLVAEETQKERLLGGRAAPMTMPGFWMDETSGVLRPAVESYLYGEPLSDQQIAALRVYLRQWIAAPWTGPGIERLRAKVDRLQSRAAISDWLDDALDEGIDPL